MFIERPPQILYLVLKSAPMIYVLLAIGDKKIGFLKGKGIQSKSRLILLKWVWS